MGPSYGFDEKNMTEALSPGRQIARGYLTGIAGIVVVRMCGFFFNILLARWLGPADFGEFILFTAVIAFAVMLSDAGFSAGVLRFVALYTGQGDSLNVRGVFLTATGSVVLLSTVVGAILFFTRDLLSVSFKSVHLPWMITVVAPLLGALVLGNLFMSALQGRQLIQPMIVLRDMIEPILRVALCAILLWLGLGLGAAVWAYVFGQLFLFFAFGILLWKIFDLGSERWDILSPVFTSLAAFSLPLLFSQLAGYLMQWVDTLLLGAMMSVREVGIYGAAQRWASIGGTPLSALAPVFLPVITRLYGEQRMDDVADYYKRITDGLMAVGFLILAATLAYSDFLMGIFGTEYLGRGTTVLKIMAFGVFVNLATGPTGALFHMKGRARLMFFTGLALLPISVGTTWFLISRWGLLGAAAAAAGVMALSNGLNVLQAFILDRLHPYSRRSLKILIIGVLCLFLSWLAHNFVAHPWLLDAPLWLVAYPVVVVYWAFSTKEINRLLIALGFVRCKKVL